MSAAALPILVEQIAHRVFQDRYSRLCGFIISSMSGIAVLLLIDSSCMLLAGVVFVAYKVTMLFLRLDRLDVLLFVDRTRNLRYIQEEIKHCVLDLHMTLQQIETFLRRNNCYTYLIARKRNETHTHFIRFIQLDDRTEKTYHLFISTRNQRAALAELLEESESYEAAIPAGHFFPVSKIFLS